MLRVGKYLEFTLMAIQQPLQLPVTRESSCFKTHKAPTRSRMRPIEGCTASFQ